MVDMLSGIPNFLCFRFSHGYFRRLHRIWKITDTIFWMQRVQMHIRMEYKGAQYPWESADDGTEQCPDWTIEPDGTCYRCYVAVYEHHVTAAVAYGIYNYVKITQDMDFLYSKGAEILTETARFWAKPAVSTTKSRIVMKSIR